MSEELHNLFPLATNAFERYMLADDRESHPMAAFMELDIRGAVDGERLVQAFHAALRRHPLLRSRARHNRLNVPTWMLAPPRDPDVADWNVPLTCDEGERLDLTRGSGMRTWVRLAPDRARITIQVHHACSDAFGKLTFLADWLTLYTHLGRSRIAHRLPQPNIDAFRSRSRTAPVSKEVRQSVDPPGILYDLYNFFYRSTVRLPGTPFAETDEDAPLSGLYGVSLGRDAFQRIRYEARKSGVSVNDWLIAALFAALGEWTAARTPQPAHKVFRVTIPYSMRTPESLYGPASNQIGYEILTQPLEAGQSVPELSRDIARFTDPVRKLRTSTFTKLLRASKVYSPLFPLIAQHWAKSFATVIFSNLGDLSRLFDPFVNKQEGRWSFDQLVVDRILCAPPTRPETHLSMVVFSYAGRLHFVTRCEGRVLAPSTLRGFLDHYRSTVLELVSIDEQDATPPATFPASTIADSA